MAITEAIGTIVSVSAGSIAAYTSSGYAALTFTAVGELESMPDHGPRSETGTFTPLSTGVVDKFHGAIDNGSFDLTVARDYADGGQDILRAAYASKNEIAFKVADPDGNITYFMAKVMGLPSNMSVGDVVRQTYPVAVTGKTIVTVEA